MQQVKESDLIGELEGFPIEVVQRMCEEQVAQGRKFNPEVFARFKFSEGEGFSWEESIEGYSFWDEVIDEKNFNLFFEKYPKKEQYNPNKLYETPKRMYAKYSKATADWGIADIIGEYDGYYLGKDKTGLVFSYSDVKEIEEAPKEESILERAKIGFIDLETNTVVSEEYAKNKINITFNPKGSHWIRELMATKKQDPIVQQVKDKFEERSQLGISKYGTTLEDNNSDDFLKHLQEELMDAVLYIQKLKSKPSDTTE